MADKVSTVVPATAAEAMAKAEILAAIRFYERRRWNWLPLVEYLAWKGTQ